MKAKKIFKGMTAAAISAILAASMVPMTAFALQLETGNVTYNLPSDTAATGTYTAYKVATATLNGSGSSYDYTLADAAKVDGVTKVDDIAKMTANSKELKNYALELAKVKNSLEDAGSASQTTETTKTLSLAPGYYLITVDLPSADMTAAPYLISVVNAKGEKDDVVALNAPKTSPLTFEKKITDVKTGTKSTTGDSAEVAVGSEVTYTITTKFPTYDSTLATNTDLTDFTIVDTVGKGLELTDATENAATVTVLGTETTVTPTTNKIENKNKLTVTFADADVIANQGKTITVVYKAKVTADAASRTAIPNNAQLTYDNNYTTGGGTKTKDDEVNVYRTDIVINKTLSDESDDVTEAQFTVYSNRTEVDGKYTYSDNDIVVPQAPVDSNGKLTFNTLPEGTYYIVETVVPDGYNKCDDIELIIKAKGDTDTEYLGTYTFTGTKATNSNEIDIQNIKGTTLPGTGGMGTTIFTIAGLGVIVIAGAMLTIYLKKRKADEE